jgi:hypothetical protein
VCVVRTDGANADSREVRICWGWRAEAEAEKSRDGELKSHGDYDVWSW